MDLVQGSAHQTSPTTSPEAQPLITHRLYGSRKDEASFAHGYSRALALGLLEVLGLGHEFVGALCPPKANDPYGGCSGVELRVYRSFTA